MTASQSSDQSMYSPWKFNPSFFFVVWKFFFLHSVQHCDRLRRVGRVLVHLLDDLRIQDAIWCLSAQVMVLVHCSTMDL